jgi:outer membrane protein insertion porin family
MMAKHTAEVRFGVSQEQMPIFFYIFGEAGNVWSDLKTSDFFSLKRAAGVGIQLMINPIGIVGFSYGYGFDTNDLTGKKEGWKFLFHLGGQ